MYGRFCAVAFLALATVGCQASHWNKRPLCAYEQTPVKVFVHEEPIPFNQAGCVDHCQYRFCDQGDHGCNIGCEEHCESIAQEFKQGL